MAQIGPSASGIYTFIRQPMHSLKEFKQPADIDRPQEFAEELTRWLERRIPKGYYGYIDIPIEGGRVSIVKITVGVRPKRAKMK